MRTRLLRPFRWTLALGLLLAAGCGSDGNGGMTAPQYEPEVVNDPNVVFTFQATALNDVSDVATYYWSVSSGSIVIHPSTATDAGTITLQIRDDAGKVVYEGDVPASGDITPPDGLAGDWRIRISLSGFSGSINFELQMQ